MHKMVLIWTLLSVFLCFLCQSFPVTSFIELRGRHFTSYAKGGQVTVAHTTHTHAGKANRGSSKYQQSSSKPLALARSRNFPLKSFQTSEEGQRNTRRGFQTLFSRKNLCINLQWLAAWQAAIDLRCTKYWRGSSPFTVLP